MAQQPTEDEIASDILRVVRERDAKLKVFQHGVDRAEDPVTKSFESTTSKDLPQP